MLSIHHNQKQLFAQRNIQANDQQVSISQQRLSSAKRINSAADDSAGLQISNRLSNRIGSAEQVQRNLSDGLSYCQIAEGALQEVSAAIQRMRVLAIYAQDGALSAADRRNLQQEFSETAAEINSIAYKTTAFNKHPLLGEPLESFGAVSSIAQIFTNGQSVSMSSGLRSIAYIPSGTEGLSVNLNDHGANDDIQIFTRAGKHLIGTPLGSPTWAGNNIMTPTDLKNTFLQQADGYLSSASYDAGALSLSGISSFNGMTLNFSGDQNAVGNLNELLTIDRTTEPLILSIVGSGSFTITLSWTKIGSQTVSSATMQDESPIKITANPTSQATEDFIQIDKAPSTLNDLALHDVALEPIEKATEALESLSAALQQVDNYRTDLGGKISQLNSASQQMAGLVQTHSQALNRIRDTDFVKESANLASTQILADAATAILAQANKLHTAQLNILLKQL